jgi:hypothetical protein
MANGVSSKANDTFFLRRKISFILTKIHTERSRKQRKLQIGSLEP